MGFQRSQFGSADTNRHRKFDVDRPFVGGPPATPLLTGTARMTRREPVRVRGRIWLVCAIRNGFRPPYICCASYRAWICSTFATAGAAGRHPF
jgi:hypothetical protein